MMRDDTIIMIGPSRTGKTTVSRILSGKLNRPCHSLDAIGYKFMREIYREGDERLYRRHLVRGEFEEWFALTRRYELHVVKRALEVYHHCILDFGAGHVVYNTEERQREINRLLEPCPNVFLLFPHKDRNKSLEILKQRYTEPLHFATAEHLVRNPAYFDLAKTVIYTEGKEPGQIVEEIEKHLMSPAI